MEFFVISFFYAGINWFYHFMFDELYQMFIYEYGCIRATNYICLLNEVHKYAFAIMCATIAYTALKRGYKVLICVLIPYLTYGIGYIFVDARHRMLEFQQADMVEYVFGIILICIIVLLGLLFKNIRANTILYTVLTWFGLLVFIFITFWSKHNWNDTLNVVAIVIKEYLFQITTGIYLTVGIFSFMDNRRKNDFVH